MCSRYELNARPRDLARRFALDAAPPVPNKAEMRPTDQALVIEPAGARLLSWGLAVDWSPKPLINARSETLAAKKTFQPLLFNRCLVPADAWFEWRKTEDGAKLRNRIARADGETLALAALSDAEAARFTIVTCAPAPSIAHVHDRMPVVLDPAAEAAWLAPGTDVAEALSYLVPFAAAELVAVEDAPPRPAQGELFF